MGKAAITRTNGATDVNMGICLVEVLVANEGFILNSKKREETAADRECKDGKQHKIKGHGLGS